MPTSSAAPAAIATPPIAPAESSGEPTAATDTPAAPAAGDDDGDADGEISTVTISVLATFMLLRLQPHWGPAMLMKSAKSMDDVDSMSRRVTADAFLKSTTVAESSARNTKAVMAN